MLVTQFFLIQQLTHWQPRQGCKRVIYARLVWETQFLLPVREEAARYQLKVDVT